MNYYSTSTQTVHYRSGDTLACNASVWMVPVERPELSGFDYDPSAMFPFATSRHTTTD